MKKITKALPFMLLFSLPCFLVWSSNISSDDSSKIWVALIGVFFFISGFILMILAEIKKPYYPVVSNPNFQQQVKDQNTLNQIAIDSEQLRIMAQEKRNK